MLSETLSSLDLTDTNVLCLYGVDKKAYLDYKSWLEEKEDRYLLFFEEEENSPEEFLEDPRVRVLCLKEGDEGLKKVAWEFVFLRFSYLARGENHERRQEIFSKMDYFQRGVHLLASDYSDFGVRVISNVRANLALLPTAKRGSGLFGKFSKVPAIICGAGPSLTSQIPLLEKLKDKALIFAGGTALNILSEHSLVPHFGANIDPEPPYHRFLEQSLTEVPFFYQNRVSKELLPIVQGPLLWIPDSGGYPIEAWLSEQQEITDAPFDGGWNVATFCTALSAAMGCDPIIFVGMDLALSQGRLYANGVDETTKKEGLIEVQDKKGNPVLSKKDWVMAAGWLGSFAQDHPSIQFFNATEDGLAFQGIPQENLEEVIKTHLTKNYDLQGAISSLIAQIPQGVGSQKSGLIALEKSLESCEKICSDLLEIFEQSLESPLKNGQIPILEIDLETEICYQKILDPLWNIWKYVFLRYLPSSETGKINVNKWLFFRRVIKELRDAS